MDRQKDTGNETPKVHSSQMSLRRHLSYSYEHRFSFVSLRFMPRGGQRYELGVFCYRAIGSPISNIWFPSDEGTSRPYDDDHLLAVLRVNRSRVDSGFCSSSCFHALMSSCDVAERSWVDVASNLLKAGRRCTSIGSLRCVFVQ